MPTPRHRQQAVDIAVASPRPPSGLDVALALGGRLGRRRVVRDSLVSLLSTAVSQSVLAVAFGAALDGPAGQRRRLRGGRVPAFHLNRSWAWGRRGRSHLLREVVPFWALAFLGLAFSTWAADFGSTMAHRAAPRMRRPQPS